MDKNSIDNYISYLVQDDKISCQDMVNEMSDLIREFKDVEGAPKLNPTSMMLGLGMKVLQKVPAEETVPHCILTMRTKANNIELTPDMEEEVKSYALCGYRRGVEEMKKPPEERIEASDYLNEATGDLTSFLNLPKEICTIAINALNDGFLIATIHPDVVQAVMIYVMTGGFDPEETKKFFDFVKSEHDKENTKDNNEQ